MHIRQVSSLRGVAGGWPWLIPRFHFALCSEARSMGTYTWSTTRKATHIIASPLLCGGLCKTIASSFWRNAKRLTKPFQSQMVTGRRAGLGLRRPAQRPEVYPRFACCPLIKPLKRAGWTQTLGRDCRDFF